MRESVVNVWIFIDQESNLAYNWSARAYNMTGSDEEKLALLKKLSATDFISCERISFPKNVKIVDGNNELEGYLPANMINSFFDTHQDLIYTEIEKTLPPLLKLDDNDLKTILQKLPENPLYVLTQVYEDKKGNQRPILNKKDVQWLETLMQQNNPFFK